MRLLVRPPLDPAECLPDYAARLADANGLRSPRALSAALRSRQRAGVLVARPWGDLAAADLRPRGRALHWRTVRFDQSELLIKTAGICPRCLAEFVGRPLRWRFWWTVACVRHGVLLSDRCPKCGSPHHFAYDTAVRCRCGHDLREERTLTPIAGELRTFHAALDAAFDQRAGLRGELCDHPALTLLKAPGGPDLARVLCALTPAPASKGSPRSELAMRYARVQTLAMLLREGEETLMLGWQEYISRRYGSCLERGATAHAFETCARVLRVCAAAPRASGVRALGRSLSDAWSHLSRTASLTPAATRRATSESLTLREVSERCGISRGKLRRLVRCDRLPSAPGRRHGRGQSRLVAAAIAGQLSAFRSTLLTPDEVAAQLQISTEQVLALLRGGVLACAWQVFAAAGAEIPRDQVSRVLRRLTENAIAPPVRERESILALPELPAQQFAPAVLAALRRQCTVYRIAPDQFGLPQWGVILGAVESQRSPR